MSTTLSKAAPARSSDTPANRDAATQKSCLKVLARSRGLCARPETHEAQRTPVILPDGLSASLLRRRVAFAEARGECAERAGARRSVRATRRARDRARRAHVTGGRHHMRILATIAHVDHRHSLPIAMSTRRSSRPRCERVTVRHGTPSQRAKRTSADQRARSMWRGPIVFDIVAS